MSNVDSSSRMEEGEESESSDIQSITSDDKYVTEVEGLFGNDSPSQQIAVDLEQEEAQQPEITLEQAAQIQARPRRALRRARATAPTAQSKGSFIFGLPLQSDHQKSLLPASDPDRSSTFAFQASKPLVPKPTAQDEGKGKEVLFSVPDHEGTISAAFRAKMQAEMQTNLDLKLKDELAKWEDEKARVKTLTDQSAGQASATIAHLKEKVKTIERKLDESFSKGEESAVKAHGDRWNSMEVQQTATEKRLQALEKELDQKKQALEGLAGDRANALAATVADRDETIASREKNIDVLKRNGQDYVEKLEREKNEQVKLVRADAASCVESLEARLATKQQQIARLEDQLASCVGSLEERLATKTQQIARLENQLASEWLFHRETVVNIARERKGREQVLRQVHRNETRQLLIEHQREQHYPDGATIVMDDDISKLTDRMSMLTCHDRPKMDDRIPVPAESTAGLPQQTITCPLLLNKQLRQELADQKASNETLRQSLAECQSRHKSQPPAEDLAARLHDLQARLKKRCTRKLVEQAAVMRESFTKDVEAREAREEEELARVKENAEEEQQRLEKVVSGLRKDLEAYYAKLEEEKNTSQAAEETVRSLQGGASLRAAERTIDAVKSKKAAEAEARSLRAANRTLEVEKEGLVEKSSSATAKAKAAVAKQDRWQAQSKYLADELERVHGRLAECEKIVTVCFCAALVCCLWGVFHLG